MKLFSTFNRLTRSILVVLFATLAWSVSAQTTLGPGDIAFTGYNSDGDDDFSFVLLKDVVSGTSIVFTDDEYRSGALIAGEGRLRLTFDGPFSCGDEFYLYRINNTAIDNDPWVVEGPGGNSTNLTTAILSTFTLNFSTSGDAMFAFQDDNPLTSTPARFISGINMTGVVWDLSNNSANDSELPSTLTNGQTAIAVTPEVDNAKYNCSFVSGTPEVLAQTINNQSNWPSDNDNAYPLSSASYCSFSCLAACTDPVITGLSQNVPSPTCPGASVGIVIAGSLNDGNGWFLREGSATATPVAGPINTTQFTVNPTETTTYFITADGCTGPNAAIGSIVVSVNGEAADAGTDQFFVGGTATLAANAGTPQTGMWTIVSGDGNGDVISPTSPNSTFTGTPGQAYVLRWTLSGGSCATTFDEVEVSFAGPTTLAAGDIAFTGYNADDPDEWSFCFFFLLHHSKHKPY